MKKFLALLAAATLAICSLAGCGSKGDTASDLDYVKNKGTLVVGTTIYEPMNYKDANDEWTGFDTEFAKLVAEELGVDVEFIVIDWDNKFPELEAKSIDCIWNGMTITEEAKLNTSVSKAYAMNAQVVVMKTDVLDQYTTIESLKDVKFAAEAGSAGAAEIVDAGYGDNLVEVSDQAAALLEVSSGSVDACVIDVTMANAMTGEGTSYDNLGYSLELSSEEYGIAFRKGSDLTEKVNEIMDKLMKDGTLDQLAEKYEITLVK